MLPSNLMNGLVLNLDGTVSGATAYDQSGQGNNGTLVNSPTTQRIGANQKAFVLNGSNQYVDVNDLDLTGDFTLACWFKKTSVGTLFQKGTSGSDALIPYRLGVRNPGSGDALNVIIGNGTNADTLYASTSLTNSVRYHGACTFVNSSKLLTIYLNGKVDGSKTMAYGSYNNADVLNIGRGYAYLAGQVNQPKIRTRALTGTEIQQLAYYKPLNTF